MGTHTVKLKDGVDPAYRFDNFTTSDDQQIAGMRVCLQPLPQTIGEFRPIQQASSQSQDSSLSGGAIETCVHD
jgi:hypothetical protein